MVIQQPCKRRRASETNMQESTGEVSYDKKEAITKVIKSKEKKQKVKQKGKKKNKRTKSQSKSSSPIASLSYTIVSTKQQLRACKLNQNISAHSSKA